MSLSGIAFAVWVAAWLHLLALRDPSVYQVITSHNWAISEWTYDHNGQTGAADWENNEIDLNLRDIIQAYPNNPMNVLVWGACSLAHESVHMIRRDWNERSPLLAQEQCLVDVNAPLWMDWYVWHLYETAPDINTPFPGESRY